MAGFSDHLRRWFLVIEPPNDGGTVSNTGTGIGAATRKDGQREMLRGCRGREFETRLRTVSWSYCLCTGGLTWC